MFFIFYFFRYGIIVTGWSSDGDPKLLAAMRYQTIHEPTHRFIQDTIHIATKLRNRFLKDSAALAMGSKTASKNHLKYLVENISKSIHGLNMSDVCPIDRQNFRSFEKIVDNRVIMELEKNVNNSEATIKYLSLCKDITSSFLSYNMEPLDRLFSMFRSVYFLRIWRNWVISSPHRTLTNNFISHNAYNCIELNSLHLIGLMKQFRDKNLSHLFLPTIFDSQTCEKTFRQLRSMGSMNFTRINFSVYDVLYMIRRIEVINDIAYFKLPNDEIPIPLSHKRAQKTQIYQLPTDEEMNSTLKKAKIQAITDAKMFKMESNNIDTFDFRSNVILEDSDDEFEDENDNIDEDEDDEFIELSELGDSSGASAQDNFNCSENEEVLNPKLDPKSPFTIVIDENGEKRKIRKSTLIWVLTEPGQATSKDRLKRVQVGKKRKTQANQI